MKNCGNTRRWDSGEIFGFFTARMMSKCSDFITVGSAARVGIDPSDVHHHIKTLWCRIGNSGYAPGHGAEAEVAQQIRRDLAGEDMGAVQPLGLQFIDLN